MKSLTDKKYKQCRAAHRDGDKDFSGVINEAVKTINL